MTPMQEYKHLMGLLGLSEEQLRSMPRVVDVFGHGKDAICKRINDLTRDHGHELRLEAGTV